jgi:hypothetical protein
MKRSKAIVTKSVDLEKGVYYDHESPMRQLPGQPPLRSEVRTVQVMARTLGAMRARHDW